jgi:ubiquinone/menaquinone biosynthesis C-methylase UbiE
MQKIMLDVGCGPRKQEGWTGMDRREIPGVDVVHDIVDTPWPFDDESCAVVMMSHLIEHIPAWEHFKVVDEVWRVLVPDGLLIVATPYPGSRGWHQDPTHCSSWNEATPYYFVPGTVLYDIYQPLPWKIEKITYDIQTTLEVAMRKAENESDGRRVDAGESSDKQASD